MPVIVTLGTVLNSLIGSVNSEVVADPTAEQHEKKRRDLHPKLACYR